VPGGRTAVALFIVVSSLLGAPAALAQSDEEVRSGKFCANCHADAVAIWGGKHGTKADSRTPLGIIGCATCHGDPSAHVKSPANPMPNRFSKMAAAETNATCMSCHQGRSRMHWPGSTHDRNDVSCASCHKVHAVHDRMRDKLTQADACVACHKELRPQIHRPYRHPIREGLVACSDCHNPHGSVGRALLVRDNVNDTCYACHMEKRGPFVRTHQPVQEDCSICHNPHGTTAPNLLKIRQPMLCQTCHEPTSHRGNIANLGGTSTGANTLARGCANCHTNIHGTNNPASNSNERTFRR